MSFIICKEIFQEITGSHIAPIAKTDHFAETNIHSNGHLPELWLRYASWDLSAVYLADRKTGAILGRVYPLDKKKNAEGLRAPRTSAPSSSAPLPPPGMAPLLQKIIHQYATTGLPPAYLPQPHNPAPPA